MRLFFCTTAAPEVAGLFGLAGLAGLAGLRGLTGLKGLAGLRGLEADAGLAAWGEPRLEWGDDRANSRGAPSGGLVRPADMRLARNELAWVSWVKLGSEISFWLRKKRRCTGTRQRGAHPWR